jgi:hypothetical protein
MLKNQTGSKRCFATDAREKGERFNSTRAFIDKEASDQEVDAHEGPQRGGRAVLLERSQLLHRDDGFAHVLVQPVRLAARQSLNLEVLDDFLAPRQARVDAQPLLVRNLPQLQLGPETRGGGGVQAQGARALDPHASAR